MLSSKPKSGISDTSNNKTVPATPKVGKIGRVGSTKSESGTPSPLQKSRISPKSVESKPVVDHRVPKVNNTAPDKQSRATKGSELQAQLGEVQEYLKKAKEQLASVEQEKARVVEELKDAKKLADEANEKLVEALAAQKKAEENSLIEKFRANELEQTSVESSRKKNEEWGKEPESIKKKHSLDVEALLSTTRELEKVKDELEVTTNAKISALNQAEHAMKIAETNSEKVELLSGEISRLKYLLDSKLNNPNGYTAEVIQKLESEIDSLNYELEIAKQADEKLVIMESLIERLSSEADNAKNAEQDSLKLVVEWKKKAELLEIQLTLESQASLAKQLEEVNASLQDAESETAVLRGKVASLEIEVADVKKAELDSGKLADEWKKKAEFLEVQLAEANQFKESLASVTDQLEDSNTSLQDVLSENASLRVKIESLEVELTCCKEHLMDSEQCLDIAQQEAIEMGKAVESLKSEIQTLQEEKLQASNSDKDSASDAKGFSEERNKLLKEFEMARQEEEKAKKAMEGLASALHEMSAEAREAQERLFVKRVEHEDAHAQIEQLRSALRNTQENYEVMLDEARYEIVCLKKAIEKLETEVKESRSAIKGSRELSSFETKMRKLENGVEVVKEDGDESRVSCANEAVAEAKAETLRLKEILLDRENKLQSISQENAELNIQEAASTEKVNELSALLAEARMKKPDESGEFSNSEKEYDMLPNSKEIQVESVNGSKEEKPKSGEDLKLKEENGNGHPYLGKEEPVEVEVKMLEGYKAIENDKENEEEAIDDDLDLKIGSGSFDNTNGLLSETTEDGAVSPTKQQQQQQKKKKHLFKFGNLLKKKSPSK